MAFLTNIDEGQYVVYPFRTKGEVLADVRTFLAGTFEQAYIRCSVISLKMAVQRANETTKTENYLGKKGKKLVRHIYSADAYERAITKMAEKGVTVERLASKNEQGEVTDVIFKLARTAA